MILAPVASQELTPSLLLQIQTQLTAAGTSPQQFTLNNIVLVMGYLAGAQAVPMEVMKPYHHDVENDNEPSVAPVSSVDEVAAEDMAIP